VLTELELEERLVLELRLTRHTRSGLALIGLSAPNYEHPSSVLCLELGSATGPSSFVGPLGKDMAVVVLPGVDRATAGAILRRLLIRFEGTGRDPRLTLLFQQDTGRTARELLIEIRSRLTSRIDKHAVALEPEEALSSSLSFDDREIVVHDPLMLKLFQLVDRVARSPLPVLVLGETGVGKEIVARLIHERSPRAAGPLVAVNCAALPEPLVESMLFGHEKGAFTNATERRKGYIEAAAGGTLFLDEIGELPLVVQAKLLRFLDGSTICRVGATTEISVDTRILAASNRDLLNETHRETFRKDLYYRIAVVTVLVPPLRDRPMDILPLGRHFAERLCTNMEREPPLFSEGALNRLMAYTWPGNIRELRNTVESAVILAGVEPIKISHFPPSLRQTDPMDATAGLPQKMAEVERSAILVALEDCNWNQTKAARKLGISRRTLTYRLRKYDIRWSRGLEQ
jgi:DNA-binding NtrC family response regulator